MPRRIVLDLAVTLDGLIEGPNGEVDWCIMDPEMGFSDFLNRIDTILFGRKSYELWGQYTPETNDASELAIWNTFHSKRKYVFSRTQQRTDDEVICVSGNIRETIDRMKQGHGRDIWLYGGANLVKTFIDLGLIDEYRLSIHPLILSEGKPLFEDVKQRLDLSLVQSRTFTSGVVQLVYQRNE